MCDVNNQKLEDVLNLALSVSKTELMASEELSTGYFEADNTWELIVKYNGDSRGLLAPGRSVEDLLAGYAIVTLPEKQIEDFTKLAQVEYIEKPKQLFPQLSNALRASCFYPILTDGFLRKDVEAGQGASVKAGEDVFIGIVDSGIAYWQNAFLTPEKETRIEWLWDQTKTADQGKNEKPPEGFFVGVEYDRKRINESLNEREKEGFIPLSIDSTGHGTYVSTIAALGAPSSRLIVVKLDTTMQKSYPATTSLLRAITYVVKKAKEAVRPVAINLSFGNTYGSHDGTSLVERFLDNASEVGRCVICVGSGNEGASLGHISGNVLKERTVELAIGNYEQSLSLQLWKNYADRFAIVLIHPGGERFVITEQKEQEMPADLFYGQDGRTRQVVLGDTRVLSYLGRPKPYQTQQEVYFAFSKIKQQIDAGIWRIELVPLSIVNGSYRMYLPSEAIRSSETSFLKANPRETFTIPSTAQKVISVGAYDAYYNAYADFSGRGQYALSAEIASVIQKPDLVAPGVNILVPTNTGDVQVSGTSFATPFVTAAAACLMSYGITAGWDPFLYGEKVKAYLTASARKLPGYEQWPNPLIGWGALCLRDSIPLS